MKYSIGQTVYWVESSTNYVKKIPCTMCFGKKYVDIILGDDSREKVICGVCSAGLNGPTGTQTVWEPEAKVKCGEVIGIQKWQEEWLYSLGNNPVTVRESQIYLSLNEAQKEQEKRLREVTEQAEKYYTESFENAKRSQVWSAGYHRNQIRDHQKSIEWHQLRLGMIKSIKEK